MKSNKETFSKDKIIPHLNNHRFSFHGKNSQYWGLSLFNILLIIITLGIYYPWAKSAIRNFLWEETELANSRFKWHGTGKEMFKGFIKAYLILGSLIFTLNFSLYFLPPEYLIPVVFIIYLIILLLIPFIIHGMVRYRLSRTSYRGIFFGYNGNLKEFYGLCVKEFLLTLVTFGIYSFWMVVNIRKYILSHSFYGDVRCEFMGKGKEFFGILLLSGILTIFTCYIYAPWAFVQVFKFNVGKIRLLQRVKSIPLYVSINAAHFYGTLLIAVLITVISLGIAAPIGQLMMHKVYLESISLNKEFDFDGIKQVNSTYRDATGDDMADILDIGL